MSEDRLLGVKTDKGGYQRLEDFCNCGPKGYPIYLTAGILFMEEEFMAIELGDRVANGILEENVEGWTALHDMSLREMPVHG